MESYTIKMDVDKVIVLEMNKEEETYWNLGCAEWNDFC